MYYKKNLDFVALIWDDLAYQIDNIDSKKQDKMLYPRFTKIIIHHFLKKDKSILMRNKTFMHTARDDSLVGTMRFVSRHKDAQIYGAILPKSMTNQAMLDSIAYKTYYAIASGAEPLKSTKPKTKSDLAISSKETPPKKKPTKAKKDVPFKNKPTSKPKPTKKNAPIKANRGKGVPDEQYRKTSGADEGTVKKKKMMMKMTLKMMRVMMIMMMMMSSTEYYEEEEEEEMIDDEENMDEEDDDEEEEDAHVTLTAVHDALKTEGPMHSSFVLFDFTEKLLNYENISPADNEIASLMDTTVHCQEPSGQTSTLFTSQFATPLIEKNVTESLKATVLARSSSQPKSTYEAAASLSEFELTKILIDKMKKKKSYDKADYKRELYDALVKSYQANKDLFDTYVEVFTLKMSRDDKDKDQDPSAGSDRGTKRRKSSKKAKSSKDSSKPLSLISDHRGRQVITKDYFINNDLEYLRVTRLTIMKKYDYGHLEEIEVRREDQQLYKFREAYSDHKGVIYKDQNNRNRLMHADELHKFSDGTLNDVLTALHDIASRIRMEYLPKRKYSGLDEKGLGL
nr:hypothetical protein [Tanacetum cinerariifolium]